MGRKVHHTDTDTHYHPLTMNAELRIPTPAAGRLPRISIGLPVYNGARHLQAALDSLLAQTFGDFEILIADNCSTDATREIAETAASHDRRIRYVRHERNLGACGNWNFVARQARSPYFKWASSNDLCDPRMLELCHADLERNPRAVLSFGHTLLIDEDGSELGIYPHDIAITGESAAERFRTACLGMRLNNAQSGLIRLDALRRTRLELPFPDSDMVLMAELAVLGEFSLLPETLLRRRMGRESASRYLSREALIQFLLPSGSSGSRWDLWKRQAAYLTAAVRTAAPWGDRVSSTLLALRLAYWERSKLLRELLPGRAA